jgi:hypothetical protein
MGVHAAPRSSNVSDTSSAGPSTRSSGVSKPPARSRPAHSSRRQTAPAQHSIGTVLDAALLADRRSREEAAARRAARGTRREAGEKAAPPRFFTPEPRQAQSDSAEPVDAPDESSPMSLASESAGRELDPMPMASLESDSSDEEGAHRPLADSPPSLPPALPLPLPTPSLARAIGDLAAALPSAATPSTGEGSRIQPRTTRVSEDQPQPRGHRQAFASAEEGESIRSRAQQQRRERERAEREMEQIIFALLANPRISYYDVLMVEFALQSHESVDAGTLRGEYLMRLCVAVHRRDEQGVRHVLTLCVQLQQASCRVPRVTPKYGNQT